MLPVREMIRRDELLEVVRGDLMFLREEWDESIEEHSLRISSPLLRRLLVEMGLQRVWKMVGFPREPQIRAVTLAPMLEGIPPDQISLAWAGGARHSIGTAAGVIQLTGPGWDDPGPPGPPGPPPEAMFGLRAYVEDTCMVVRGQHVPRRVLLKYVANKLGGAHYDPKRGTSDEDRLHRLLDETNNTIQILGQRPVYSEMLATGQAVVKSKDVERLYEHLSRGA